LAVKQYTLPTTHALIDEQIIRQNQQERVRAGRKITENILSPFGFLQIEHIPSEVVVNQIKIEMREFSLGAVYIAVAGSEQARQKLYNAVSKHYRDIDPEFTTISTDGNDEVGLAEVLAGLIGDLGGSIVSQDSTSSGGQFNWRLTVQGLSRNEKKFLHDCVHEDERFNVIGFAPEVDSPPTDD
jgi:hypothetical protein